MDRKVGISVVEVTMSQAYELVNDLDILESDYIL